jgi:hypothetical protein
MPLKKLCCQKDIKKFTLFFLPTDDETEEVVTERDSE